jgi:hypothetical protein
VSDTPRTDKLYEEVWRFTNETDAVDALISMRDLCRELERENAALRAAIAESEEFGRKNGETLAAKVSELLRENAALREDKERLDWLDANGDPVTYEDAPHSLHWGITGDPGCRNLRAAIDAARKEAQP